MESRNAEDRLREEYFRLLPDMTRVAGRLKTQVEYGLLPVMRALTAHESLLVKVRIKDCVSAIDKLRRRQFGAIFDPENPERYSLRSLRDLVGLRVLAFPPSRAAEVDSVLRGVFPSWKFDPILDENGEQLAYKYNGVDEGSQMTCEYQIVSTLIGLFWEVEHAAIYKQAPNFRGLAPVMHKQTSAVYLALNAFEEEFERLVKQSQQDSAEQLGGLIAADS
jgi:hypothetical protein